MLLSLLLLLWPSLYKEYEGRNTQDVLTQECGPSDYAGFEEWQSALIVQEEDLKNKKNTFAQQEMAFQQKKESWHTNFLCIVKKLKSWEQRLNNRERVLQSKESSLEDEYENFHYEMSEKRHAHFPMYTQDTRKKKGMLTHQKKVVRALKRGEIEIATNMVKALRNLEHTKCENSSDKKVVINKKQKKPGKNKTHRYFVSDQRTHYKPVVHKQSKSTHAQKRRTLGDKYRVHRNEV